MTGWPAGFRLVAFLVFAVGEGSVLATGEERSARAAAMSVSWNRLPQMPLDMIGEHAQEDVGAYAFGGPVADRADLKIDRLQASEGALHPGQILVGLDRLIGVERRGGNAGAHDIDAVEPGLARDAVALAPINHLRLADLDLEMLGRLVLADHRADGAADLGGAAQGVALGAHTRGDAGEGALGRRQPSL